MPALRPDVDPDGLLEYSVVYTDRALNHMSARFQKVLTDITATLKEVYAARAVAIVPGSGTYGMEAVARQFATGAHVLVIRNGWFSYRWTQILDMGAIPKSSTVMKARRIGDGGPKAPFAPAPVDEVVARIAAERPAVVFAPHVETSAGMILPDDYLRAVADATHAVGGLFVLDCIASGTVWVDMAATGVDVLVSAPQKGWSGPPCCGLVMLSERARAAIETTTSTSFACDLRKWLAIAETYEGGAVAYHATMPTDALAVLRDVMVETRAIGFGRLKDAQIELGRQARARLAAKGFPSVAADGFGAPGVIVSYTDDAQIQNGAKLKAQGLQIAAGVPLQCDEGADFRTFRIGLFGLDKLADIPRTVEHLDRALSHIV
ncbi:aminotransferase class V-fold PLP-dependent enzyme [Leptothrix discophora]|uniref:Aminotransferase class V-fold PLP-dependent enzyme n=1 Tax=Leptothrix discophora TaxID=89 RepID=A0ABT9G3W0_LEPDI|nr:aminotransferase class V-fold PLP-dependent enzyme [Leptothrix discophora]MDP4301091.1 aminotransferase class V-fold PLP-dependent enzyme [Leptothrix discophora]